MPDNKVHDALCVELHDWVTARFKGNEIKKQLNAQGSEETAADKITTYILDLLPDNADGADSFDDVVISLVDHSAQVTKLERVDQVHFAYPHELVSDQSGQLSDRFTKTQKELKDWAMRHQLGFDARDISVDQSKRGEKDLQESRFSPLTGTVKTSVQTLENARVIIKHSDVINDSVRGARTRRIHRIYVENGAGERFLMPFVSLRGARAMARHVNEGGNPYDQRGQTISGLAEEVTQLSRFVRRTRNQQFEDVVAGDIIGAASQRLAEVKTLLHRVSGERGYRAHGAGLDQAPVLEYDQAIKTHFVRNQYDEQLDNSLPWAWRAYQMSQLQEMDQFEQWADGVVAEEAPEDPKVASLKQLMGIKPPTEEPKGIQVQKTAAGTLGITVPKDDPEAGKQAAKFFGAGGASKLPAGTTIAVKENDSKKEICLTDTKTGKKLTIPVPTNVGMSHLTDIMAKVQKAHPGMEMTYWEDGKQIDEVIGGDLADDLIDDTKSAGQSALDADEPRSLGTGADSASYSGSAFREGHESGHNTIGAATAEEIMDRYYHQNEYIGDLMDEFPALRHMMDDIVIDYHLHPDDDHEAIEARLMDHLAYIAKHHQGMNEADMEEGNEFTAARLAAIKAGKRHFTVGGKTYPLSGDTSDEKRQLGMKEELDRILKLSGQRR